MDYVQTPLPTLEAEGLTSTRSAGKQKLRQSGASDIARVLLGEDIEPVLDSEGDVILVNRETGEVLEAGPGLGRPERFATLLWAASMDQNHYVGILDGERCQFEGSGALWAPSLRLDPNWMEVFRRRSRKTAREAIKRVMGSLHPKEHFARKRKLNWRLSWKLMTLTMPHVEEATTEREVRRLNDAFRRLGKMESWGQIHAGVKGVEDAITPDGPHVHAHVLALSRFLDTGRLRREWWMALNKATLKEYGHGIALMPAGLPFIDIREVRKRGGGETVSTDDALNEVTKYVTKPSDLTQPDENGRTISRDVVLELCEVARWPRMFELLGAARKPAPPKAEAQLDTSCISAVSRDGRKAFRVSLGMLEEAIEGTESWLTESLEPEERVKPPDRPRRPPTWRELMDTETLSAWLRLISGRTKRGRRFRLNWVLEHNPGAMIATMDGKVYFGINHEHAE